jgi:predicted  nucleic acid-binding Zn-ribbon protein
MRTLFLCLIGLTSFSAFSQMIKAEESSASFRDGKVNVIVVNVPFVDEKTFEEALKSQLKDWNGKYDSSRGEMNVTQGTLNALGIKPFNAKVKVLENKKEELSFALAIDLGGTYLNRSEHKMYYESMAEKMRLFALKIAKETIEDENKKQTKLLSGLEKNERNLVKDKEDLENSIKDYEKKIEDAKKNIDQNIKDQSDKRNGIAKQKAVVEFVEMKMKSLK